MGRFIGDEYEAEQHEAKRELVKLFGFRMI